jgi:hypothetical protein
MSDRFTPREHRARGAAGRVAPLVAGLMALVVVAPTAGAKTVTLHYFSKQTSSTFLTPQGQPLGSNSQPAVGDINDVTDVDYVGNHKHHAKKANASDHLRCKITAFSASTVTGACDLQAAIGGSMVLANDQSVSFFPSAAPLVLPINGGTGIYRHARGKIIAKQLGNDADITVKMTY